MIEKEYLTVLDISRKFTQTPRNVRRIIGILCETKGEILIHKDEMGRWRVHHLLLKHFTRQRQIVQKYYGLTIDPPTNLSRNAIDEIMKFVVDKFDGDNLELNYTVELKKKNGKSHIHCFINCNKRTKLLECLQVGFSNFQYRPSAIFDLAGWVTYITKDDKKITRLIKKAND